MPPDSRIQLGDIQGGILRGYNLPVACYLFLGIEAAAAGRDWLGRIAGQVTSATPWDGAGPPPSTLNVALAFTGLRALGLAEELLASFPEEFRQGMAARAALLGDTGLNAPQHWDSPLGTAGVHALVTVHGRNRQTCAERVGAVTDRLGPGGVRVVYRQEAAALLAGEMPVRKEHFGYRDAIGQVAVEGDEANALPGQGVPGPGGGWRPVKAGEFFLGYPDEVGADPALLLPRLPALGQNGTFLVFRKLHQHVALFRQFLRDHATDDLPEELLAAKLVGRWRSGAPLVLAPDQDDPDLAKDPRRNNDFRYLPHDRSGKRCPRGAHIRRMNPRDALDGQDVAVRRHLILRRGLPYGPPLPADTADDGADRGVCFLGYSASISRQFEFIQEAWVGSGEFAELDRADRDPILGTNDGTPASKFVVQGKVPGRLYGLPSFVTVKGGEYFFVPGLTALWRLAEGRWD